MNREAVMRIDLHFLRNFMQLGVRAWKNDTVQTVTATIAAVIFVGFTRQHGFRPEEIVSDLIERCKHIREK